MRLFTSRRNGPPERQILPVELLVIVGQFLAGDRKLGTLASLNSASKPIQEETKAILYETLFLKHSRKVARALSDPTRTPLKWRYCKYVFLTGANQLSD